MDINPVIRSIRFKCQYDKIPQGMIHFDDTNPVVIVGDNGDGKTTLLNCIETNFGEPVPEEMVEIISDYTDEGEDYTIALDCVDVMSMEMSPGECVLEELFGLMGKSGEVLLIDTPEAFLSIRNQVTVTTLIHKLAQENQVIVTTNSIPLIRSVREVYDMTESKWVDAKAYTRGELMFNVLETKEGTLEIMGLV